MVVHHVENDLDARPVQRLDHLLEFAHLLAVVTAGAVAGVGGEEVQRVVTPIVAQPGVGQMTEMRQEVMHWHQFDRSDVNRAQMGDGSGMRQTGVGSAQFLRNLRMQTGESPNVQFVDLRPSRARACAATHRLASRNAGQ